MKLLDEYLDLQQRIYDYFGYRENWVVFPIDDNRDRVWYLTDDEVWSIGEDKNTPENWNDGMYCADELCRIRLGGESVLRKDDFTMICIGTHMDGNKFLAIFDNSKELKENPVNEEY